MPNKEVEFHEAASKEFEAAFDWYLERSAGAAARFANEMGRAIASIVKAPQRWAVGIHGTRKIASAPVPLCGGLPRASLHYPSAGHSARASAARLLERPTLKRTDCCFEVANCDLKLDLATGASDGPAER